MMRMTPNIRARPRASNRVQVAKISAGSGRRP